VKISIREMGLAWVTAVVIILTGTYWLCQPKANAWKAAIKEREALGWKMKEMNHLLGDQTNVNQRLDVLRKQLPQHPQGKDVTAELLMTIERTAQQHGLVLLRREPEKEKSVGDLYEVAINCMWESTLDALVHFLYALQIQGAILDIRQLTMTPGQGGPDRLKGSFTVDCAYTRTSVGREEEAPPEPAQTKK
jgi:Tfp pilus assembly protein PilO